VLNAAGQLALDALAPGMTLTDSFTYTLNDGDGDADPATVVVTLRGSDDPPVITGLTPAASGGDATVDEDDLASGSDAVKESLTATGTFTISAPDGVDDLTVGGIVVIRDGVFQAGASGATPLGNAIAFTSYDPATGVVGYSVTLLAAEAHAAAGGENDLFDNLGVTLTDSDGDVASETLSIRIVDDVPTARNDTAEQLIENAAVVIDAFANDLFGADGVDIDNSPAVRVTWTQPPSGQGSVTYNAATGLFTFTPAPGQAGSTSFTYTLQDGDGDLSQATVTINLRGDSTPRVVNVIAKLDDDALADGNSNAVATDIDANAGEVPLSASEGIFNGKIVVNWGGDAAGANLSFANLHGQTGTVGTEAVTYSWNGATSTLSAVSAARGTIFTVLLDPSSGAYTVTSVKPVLHAAGGEEASAFVDLNYLATDSDNDQDTTGKLTIEFNDDTPNAFQPSPVTTINGDSPAVTGQLNLAMGADGLGSLVFSSALNGTVARDQDGRTLQVAGDPLVYEVSGNVLTARTATGTVGFVVQLNSDGSYSFDVQALISNGTDTSFNNLTGTRAGNTDYVGIGANDSATAIDVLLSGSRGNNPATVNTDNDSIGAANQSMNANETIRFDLVRNLVSGASTPSGFNFAGRVDTNSFLQAVPQVQANQGQTVSLQVWALNSTNTAATRPDSTADGDFSDSSKVGITTVRVVDGATGATASGALTSVGQTVTVGFGITATLQADGSVVFAGIQQGDRYGIATGDALFNAVVVKALGDFDLGVFSVGTLSAGTPIVQLLPIIATDADGDSVSASLSATINPAGTTGTAGARTMQSSSLLVSDVVEGASGETRMSASSTNLAQMAGLAAGFAAMPAAASPIDGPNVRSDGQSLRDHGQSGSPRSLDEVRLNHAETRTMEWDDASTLELEIADGPVQRSAVEPEVALVAEPVEAGAEPVSSLDAGTDPSSAQASPMTLFTGGEIHLPAPDQMAALAEASAKDIGPVQGISVLDSILVDALAGGGSAIDLDRVIDAAIGSAGEGTLAHGGFATPLLAAVSGWDGSDFSPLFTASATAMEHTALHADAIQPIANG
jgi:hypothetical protein